MPNQGADSFRIAIGQDDGAIFCLRRSVNPFSAAAYREHSSKRTKEYVMLEVIVLLKALLAFLALTAFCYWQIRGVERAQQAKHRDRK